MSARYIHRWTDVQTTVNAATANFLDPDAANERLPAGSAARVQVTAIGYSAGSNLCTSIQKASVIRNTAGVFTIAATSAQQILGDAGLGTASMVIVMSGSDIEVQITGVAATTVKWMVYVEITAVG